MKPWVSCCWEAVGNWSLVARLEPLVGLPGLLLRLRLRLSRVPDLAGGAGLVLIGAELRLLFSLQPAATLSAEGGSWPCSTAGLYTWRI